MPRLAREVRPARHLRLATTGQQSRHDPATITHQSTIYQQAINNPSATHKQLINNASTIQP
jgi:hypothetical protein